MSINAGNFNHKIDIYSVSYGKDSSGFKDITRTLKASPYASVKTTKGMTLIKSGTDFEKAFTNFTIRFPKAVNITRNDQIDFRGKTYTIEYLNNVNEENVLLEMQCKEITH